MSLTLAATLGVIDELRRRGENFCVVTVVRTANATSAKAGAKAVVTADGALQGFVGGSCVQGAVRRAALEVLRSGDARLIRVKPKDEITAANDPDGVELHGSSCPSGGTVELFLEPTKRHLRVVICGASPVAATLARLAQSMGYVTIAVAAASDQGQIGFGDHVITGFDLTELSLGAGDAVVVATQGQNDRAALAGALKSDAGYVGMVGSRAKIANLMDRLGDDVAEARKRSLRGPAGLDLGAIDPEEIALSILGEIIKKRRKGD